MNIADSESNYTTMQNGSDAVQYVVRLRMYVSNRGSKGQLYRSRIAARPIQYLV